MELRLQGFGMLIGARGFRFRVMGRLRLTCLGEISMDISECILWALILGCL